MILDCAWLSVNEPLVKAGQSNLGSGILVVLWCGRLSPPIAGHTPSDQALLYRGL